MVFLEWYGYTRRHLGTGQTKDGEDTREQSTAVVRLEDVFKGFSGGKLETLHDTHCVIASPCNNLTIIYHKGGTATSKFTFGNAEF